MALNIKNERVCRLAKEAAERTGRTQVSVLEEALEHYLAELASAEAAREREVKDRLDRVQQIVAEFNEGLTDEDRAAIRRYLDEEMYDEDGLPR
ncbi:MAG: type II toxin-antitoxin system VapB family antitoxin [Actinomycetales bacterium]|jgi:antitoxin VapB|nr:type II toxin-antitoxin system VapB family antitoxin [Candidatus Phosphoribacter baldrii]MBK6954143.1 type II toxin-antitoxin system VapB family antitoxin [Candidatus Phosphoribacter baldrii]